MAAMLSTNASSCSCGRGATGEPVALPTWAASRSCGPPLPPVSVAAAGDVVAVARPPVGLPAGACARAGDGSSGWDGGDALVAAGCCRCCCCSGCCCRACGGEGPPPAAGGAVVAPPRVPWLKNEVRPVPVTECRLSIAGSPLASTNAPAPSLASSPNGPPPPAFRLAPPPIRYFFFKLPGEVFSQGPINDRDALSPSPNPCDHDHHDGRSV